MFAPPSLSNFVPMGPMHSTPSVAANTDKKSMLTEAQRASIEKEKYVFVHPLSVDK
jgi:hypothetical protein